MTAGFVTADPLIPAQSEIQGLKILTDASVDGQLKNDCDIAWQTSSGSNLTAPLGVIMPSWSIPADSGIAGDYILWIGNPILDAIMGSNNGGIQYYTVYSEDTAANQGHTGYSSNLGLTTGNTLAGQSNIEATRAIIFRGDIAGSMSSNEKMTLDGVGQFTLAEDQLICPFGAELHDFIPAFCNKVETGSEVLISTGSLTTNAKERFVAASSDAPVTVDYSIQVTGAESPAKGSVLAYINAQTREGDVDVLGKIPFICEDCCPDCEEGDIDLGTFYWVQNGLVSEVTLSDKTSVSGDISLFEKNMHYESGLTV
jgi:hypothetical protein